MPDPIRSTARRRSTPYALAVLGGGVAAVAAGREAARRGAQVALLVPDEAAQQSPETGEFAQILRAHQARRGLRPPPLPVDEPRIDIFRGPLRFSRYRTVSVGGVEVRFRKAVVATGAEAGPVEIAGAEAAEPLLPHQLDRLAEPPRRLAVLGSGAEACFWAQQLHRLGSEVHLIAAVPRLLEASDERAVPIISGQLEAEGVRLYTGCQDVALDRTGNRRGVLICRGAQREKLLVDEVLVCFSPRPRIADLALETAAVGYSERGIAVDDWLSTEARDVFAAGGACGPRFASPEAEEGTGRLAARNALAWLPRRLSRWAVPRYTPTDPPMVELGLRPAEAAARGIETAPRRVEFHEGPPAAPEGKRRSYLTIWLDRRRRLVGATIVGRGAEELASALMLLMHRGRPLDDLGELAPCRSGLARGLTELILKPL